MPLWSVRAQGAPAGIGNGARYHDRNAPADLLKILLNTEECSLGIQRIEHGLYEQYVHAPVHQAFHLKDVGILQLVERDGTETWVVHIRREAGSAIRWADAARHKTWLVGLTGP
jgi:hypothetical protein